MRILVNPNWFQRKLLSSHAVELKETVLDLFDLTSHPFLDCTQVTLGDRSTLILPKDPSLTVLCMAALCLIKGYPNKGEIERLSTLEDLCRGWIEPHGELLELVRAVEDSPLLPIEVRIGYILGWMKWGSVDF